LHCPTTCFREASRRGIRATLVVITAEGGYSGQPAVSTGVSYSVEIEVGPEEDLRSLRSLVQHVDEIAEIPNSLRKGSHARLKDTVVRSRNDAPGNT
jgi:hypothetical protein